MQRNYEPLKAIETTDSNLYAAIAMSMLLPLVGNGDAFNGAFELLFGGSTTLAECRALRQALQNMNNHEVPGCLPGLINAYLRPRFASYCAERGLVAAQDDDYPFIQDTMAQMLGLTIQHHDLVSSPDASISYRAYPEPGQALHVLQQREGWQPLVDASRLPPELSARLFIIMPNITTTALAANAVGARPHYCAAFEGMVAGGITTLQDVLATLPTTSPQSDVFLTSRTIVLPHYSSRSNQPHDLSIRYENLDQIVQGVNEDVIRVNLRARQEFPEPWENSILHGAGGGAVAGVIVAGVATLATEYGLSFALGSLVLLEGVPLAAVITLVGIGIGSVGGVAAKHYGDQLLVAKQYLDDEQYVDAGIVLDEVFASSAFIQWTRSFFLSDEHQAIAHFYRAICYEKTTDSPQLTPHEPVSKTRVFEHYTQAASYAQKANREFIHFISNLCKLNLLRKSISRQSQNNNEDKEVFNNTLQSLTINRETAFQDLYSRLNDNMRLLTRVFSGDESLGLNKLAVANQFLNFDGFCMLRYLANGHGGLTDVLGLCVQGALLAKLHQTNPDDGLQPETKTLLISRLSNEEREASILNLTLASKKMTDAAKLLSELKIQYAARLSSDAALRGGIARVEDFILRFHAFCHPNGVFFKSAYKDIVDKLRISTERAQQILALTKHSIKFLNELERDFGHRIASIDAWLEELITPNGRFENKVNPNSGNTMLHYVIQIPFINDAPMIERIRNAAQSLKSQAYTRNHQEETPLFALKRKDDYHLNPVLCPSEVIKLGDELTQVEDYLQALQNNPSKTKHFLLMEGPAGTGKSEMVLEYLKSQQYCLHSWVDGDPEDKWVNGLKTRVIQFFKDAVSAARHNPLSRHILFVDEINSVCPELVGNPKNGTFNHRDIAEAFQKQVDALKSMNNICLVGTTNFPDLVAKAMLSRAKRVIFNLPDITNREKLLQHFFRDKRISNENISRTAALTEGWSPRAMRQISASNDTSVDEISEEILMNAFAQSTALFQSDFTRDYPNAEISLPTFRSNNMANPLAEFAVVSPEIRDQFEQMSNFLHNPDFYRGARMHVLLYGPPGGGKTTAIRAFSEGINYTFILIKAGIGLEEMRKLLQRAKTFNPAIIFIDEIDKIAFDGSPFRELLQEEMDGFHRNNIVFVGATNYLERIPEPVIDRFIPTYMAPFAPEQRGQLIATELRTQLARLDLYFVLEPNFERELANGCLHLAQVTQGQSLRVINRSIILFFGDLRARQNTNPGIQIVVRLQNLIAILRPRANAMQNPHVLFQQQAMNMNQDVQNGVVETINRLHA